jgi:alginate O-acetyltransferase complex protein AlgI
MLFNSHVFVFAFLPLTVVGFLVIRQAGYATAAIAWLFLTSSVFYAWWHPAYLGLLYAIMLGNYVVGRVLAEASWDRARLKALLIAGLAANLGILGWFKYANFLTDNLNAVSGARIELARIVLPLAISFFIFQKIAFLVDTYNRKIQPQDLLRYSLFVLFFPQLIAGPIVRYQEVAPQFTRQAVMAARSRATRDLAIGLTIFAIGLFKKVMIADGIARFSTPMFDGAAHGATLDFLEAWVAAIAYGLQLYFDFSGYSDMAVGLARMVGIRLPVNFWSPYKATSVVDFWRRWHITLSRFLRDYLYIPLGGNRRGSLRQYTNLLLTMALGGLWHGASWNFLVWGLLHGVYLVTNHVWAALGLSVGRSVWWPRVATFLAVTVAWVFFRAADLGTAFAMLGSMAGFHGISVPKWLAEQGVSLGGILRYDGFLPNSLLVYELRPFAIPSIAMLLLACWLLPNTWEFMQRYRPAIVIYAGRVEASRWRWQPHGAWAAFTAAVLGTAILGMGGGISEFLYFQF